MVSIIGCASKSVLKQANSGSKRRIELECACLHLRHLQQVCYEVCHTVTLRHNLTQAVLLPVRIHFATRLLLEDLWQIP